MKTSGNSVPANVSFIFENKLITLVGWISKFKQISFPWSWQLFVIFIKKQTWKTTCFNQFWANLWIFILKLSDVRKKSDINKKGLYQWDLVRFNCTSCNMNMTSFRNGLRGMRPLEKTQFRVCSLVMADGFTRVMAQAFLEVD